MIRVFAVAHSNCGVVHPVCLNYPWGVSGTWLQSTCGKMNWWDPPLCVQNIPRFPLQDRDVIKSEELWTSVINRWRGTDQVKRDRAVWIWQMKAGVEFTKQHLKEWKIDSQLRGDKHYVWQTAGSALHLSDTSSAVTHVLKWPGHRARTPEGRPEEDSSQTIPIQSDRAWEDLPGIRVKSSCAKLLETLTRSSIFCNWGP